MAGVAAKYPGTLPITSSKIFGTTIVSCGPTSQASRYNAFVKKEKTFYHRLLVKEGVLQGFILIGNIKNIGQLRKILLEKKAITPPIEKSSI